MNEIEVKILEIDVNAIVKRLEELGAKKTADEEIDAILFDVGGGNVLRLRRKGEKIEFCFKKRLPGTDTKSMEETEVFVDDFDRMLQILTALGFTEKNRIKKHRISYSLVDVHYEFDTIPGIPTYLEIEAQDEETLRSAVERIGFTMADTVTYGRTEVLKRYGKQ